MRLVETQTQSSSEGLVNWVLGLEKGIRWKVPFSIFKKVRFSFPAIVSFVRFEIQFEIAHHHLQFLLKDDFLFIVTT